MFSWDGIALDKGMFDSKDVGVMSCAFVRAHARGRNECQVPVATFEKLQCSKSNRFLSAPTRFRKRLDQIYLRAISSCFDEFNRCGGAFVKTNGEIVHFQRAAIVAVYADLPAARKVALTGSACNVCFTPKNNMASGTTATLRTFAAMAEKKQELLSMLDEAENQTAVKAIRKEATDLGVDLEVVTGFATRGGQLGIFGPDSELDHPWSALPAVFLHGMEAGTLVKLPEAALDHALNKATQAGISATSVCRELDNFCATVAAARCRNTNVELGRHELMSHNYGISEHMLNRRTLDGALL